MYTQTAMLGLNVPLRASERAYRQLRGEILNGLLAPGTALLEVEQAERIGVSRTPLREAVARLIADGLVVGRRGRGFEVTDISVDSISELYELRQALEVQAIRLAATRREPTVFIELRKAFVSAPELLDQGDAGVHRYYLMIDELEDAVDAAVENPFLVAVPQIACLVASSTSGALSGYSI